MQEEPENEASLRGQADIWKYKFGFADSMALKCAVELRISDITHSHSPTDGASNSKPMIALSELASSIAPSPDMTYLTRIMRLLVRRNIFAIHHPFDDAFGFIEEEKKKNEVEREKEATEVEASLRGQADIWKYMFGFADSMALKCAVELRIADIIHSHSPTDGASNSRPMITLSQLASSIAPSPDMTYLTRIMRLLVRRNIFAIHHPSDGREPLYGLTHSSRWLLHNEELSLAPMLVMENHPCLMAPWHCFGQCVKEKGPYAFKMAHGLEIWDYASQNPEFNKLFNDGMACTARVVMKAILTGYEHGFDGVASLVDVGGGTGSAVAEIVKAYPNIKGFNFDLPHVVATAPVYHGVSHVGGDMFEGSIPNADAVFMKWIMHDWSDSDCIKILKNCRKAIPEKSGKIVIVDIVLEPNGEGVLDDTRLVFDLLMIAHTSGGRERTESEWKKILKEGGFPRYKVIKIPALASIVEAYPM